MDRLTDAQLIEIGKLAYQYMQRALEYDEYRQRPYQEQDGHVEFVRCSKKYEAHSELSIAVHEYSTFGCRHWEEKDEGEEY